MKTSLPMAGSSSNRYNLRKTLKKKSTCACCIGKKNVDHCKSLVKLEKSKEKSTQPLLNEEEKVPELTDAAKMYMKLSKEKIGIQIPESYARLIKPEHNLKICMVSAYKIEVYPTFDSPKEEVYEVKENIEEHFLEFKKDCVNKLTMSNIQLTVPKSIIDDYICDGELPISIMRPFGEPTIYDVVRNFFIDKKHVLKFESDIMIILLNSFELIFQNKKLFKNEAEEYEYEQNYDEYFKTGLYSIQLGLRFLIRFILNLPKWNIMGTFHKDTKTEFVFCINEFLKYLSAGGIQDPNISQHKRTLSILHDQL